MAEFTEFQPLKYNPQEVAQRGFGMASSGATDDRLIVGFLQESVLNQFKSRQEGKPVYEDHTFVKIQHPGETLNIVKRPVREDDKQRWPRQWAQFQAGVSQVPAGIPITLLFPDKPSIAATLKGYNIHTVEQLSNLSAQGMSTVGLGCQDWVNGAKRYMEHAEKGVSHHKFETELTAMKSENLKLQRQVSELTALVHQRNRPEPNMQTHDFQTEQLNAVNQSNEGELPPPAQFVQDLSTEAKPRRGRPPGSKKQGTLIMALQTDLMGSGMPAQLATLIGNLPSTLAGVGTSQASGALINGSMMVLTTGSGQSAFTFKSAVTLTRLFFMFNSTATTALIYPPVGAGANFNGGSTDAAFSLAQNKAAIIWRFSATQFMSVLTA